MKFKFNVKIYLAYWDIDHEVEVELNDEEVERIKELVAKDCEARKKAKKERQFDKFPPEQDLLDILEEKAPKLFEKFWDVILPPVFVECLIDGFENFGEIEKAEEDNFMDYRKADFDKLYEMYDDTMDITSTRPCLCEIPKEWMH